MDSSWLEPKTQYTEDIESSERGMQFKVNTITWVSRTAPEF